jgi:hypothetical protein
MNNYVIKHEPETSLGSAIIIAAGLFGTLILRPDVAQSTPDLSLIRRPPVRIEQISKTYDKYTNIFTGEYENPNISLEQNLAIFYTKLLTTQEPLEKDFEKILYDNLWELIVYT